jgi:hypothetical protein
MTEKQSPGFPKDAEEARIDRDVTREELAETLDALGKKLDVKTRVSESVDEKLDQATATVAGKLSDPAAERFRKGAEAVRGNPLPAFAGILGIVILLRLILRRRNS